MVAPASPGPAPSSPDPDDGPVGRTVPEPSRRRDATGATRSPPSARPSSASASARPPSRWPCRPARSATPTAPSCCGAPRWSPTTSSGSSARSGSTTTRPACCGHRRGRASTCSPSSPPATGTRRSSSRCSPRSWSPGSPAGSAFAVRIGAVSALAVAIPDLTRERLQRRRPPHERPVDERAPARRPRRRLRPPHLRRGRPRSTRSPSTGSAACPTPTRCSSRCTGSPRRLPASLDLDEVLDTTMQRLRDLFDFDAVAVLLLDDDRPAAGTSCAGRAPARPSASTDDELPAPLRAALLDRAASSSEPNLLAGGGPGLARELASGLYAVLPARGSIIGLLVASSTARPDHFTDRDVELLTGFVEPAGARHRQRPVVRPPAHRRRRRGAHPHRPRPPRPHRPVARLPRLRARPHRASRRAAATTLAEPLEQPAQRRAAGDRRGARHPLRPAHRRVRDARTSPPPSSAFLDRVRDRSGLEVELERREHRPAPAPPGARAVAHRPGGGHQRRAPRRGHPGRRPLAVRRHRGRARGRRRRHRASRSARPAGSTPTGSSGMRERAASIGATLDIDSERGPGRDRALPAPGRVPHTSAVLTDVPETVASTATVIGGCR